MIVLDTNVISEFTRPTPDERVKAWFRTLGPEDFATTAINEAEVFAGLVQLPQGKRRDGLLQGAMTVMAAFGHRIFPFDRDAAQMYPLIVLQRRVMRLATGIADGQIAAIAKVHGATVATRNVNDFAYCGLDIINPWTV